MNKIKMRFSVLILLMTGIVMFSCGDDGEEETRIENFSLSTNSFVESSSDASVQLQLSANGSINDAVSATYRFEDGEAKSGTDYQATGGTAEFAPGQSSASISFSVVGDTDFELSESLNLIVTYEGVETVFAITIDDDDAPSTDLEQLEDGATTPDSYPSMTKVWADEFDGETLNTTNWNYEIGDGCDRGICGWSNDELQSYTDELENAKLVDGKLVITATELIGSYESARITTQDKFEFTFGRIDVRAKMPKGQGLWPAIWMLGANINEPGIGWPLCGEIDIMELVGHEPDVTHGTVHYQSSGQYQTSTGSFRAQAEDFSEKFHVYTLTWDRNTMSWYVDGALFRTFNRANTGDYPFNDDFFFIMNVAVGGRWPGNPDGTTVFPQAMEVDYIRVFR